MAGRPPSSKAPPFGRKLAALRREHSLTQQQLADLLGISIKRVDYYERRAADPSVGIVKQVADAFGISVSVLIDEDEVPKKRRAKHGPPSALEERIERLRQLPKGQQETVIKMLDGLLGASAPPP